MAKTEKAKAANVKQRLAKAGDWELVDKMEANPAAAASCLIDRVEAEQEKLAALQERPIKIQQVAALLGVSKHRVRQLKDEDPSFPRPFKLGKARNSHNHWRQREVLDYIEIRRAAK